VTTARDTEVQKSDLVSLTIDGIEVNVPKGTLIIRAAEEVGIEIPRFCDHPGLDPVGACRQCLVEVWMPGPPGPDGTPGDARQMQGPPGRMKPQASCTMTVAPGMVVKTQLTSPAIDKAQQGVMELLLVNHPLDCPVCDKGGECPLQNQAMSHGRATSRFEDVKRTYPKPINISSQVLLDRERCVLCARCTRFSDQIAGDPFIELVERGALQQVGIYEEQPFESYFSGNTVQICPVGALTGAAYRFRARPFDLVSTQSVCEHCASGCAQRTDHRRGQVMRRMASYDPAVNEEWNCDKGRWAFTYPLVGDRLQFPMVREDGVLRVASWPEALAAAADGLAAAGAAGPSAVGVLVGGRVSMEDAHAYTVFAQQALGGADIDFRSRPHSVEEADFLTSTVRGSTPDNGAVTYADLERASSVLLVGFEPEDESPIVFLRLRKAFRKNKTAVYAVAPLPTRGLTKVGGTLLASAPGTEAQVLDGIAHRSDRATESMTKAGEALKDDGAVILVGERLAGVPGGLSAALRLADTSGARLAWVPRRAGERGALEAGALSGRGAAAMLSDAAVGKVGGLLVGGVDPYDVVAEGLDTEDVLEALRRAFVVSLEVRESAVTELADVVLPVAPHAEKAGTFVNWEGRARRFGAALDSGAMSDYRVLDMLATEMGATIGTRTLSAIRDRLGVGSAPAAVAAPSVPASMPMEPGAGQVLLATWHHLLDMGRMQDGEPFLAGTAPATIARVSAATAQSFGLEDGDAVEVSTESGSIVLPVAVTEGMVDHVVWMPTNSAGAPVRSALGVDSGAVVGLRRASLEVADATPVKTEDGVA
jgi:NADH-quinone oxidoreductase subunit G